MDWSCSNRSSPPFTPDISEGDMRSYLALTLVLVAGASAQAQSVVDPGMNKAQVVAKLGKPLAERTHEGRTYLYYDNKMEKKVGMNDLVILDNDKVVDAIFRAG